MILRQSLNALFLIVFVSLCGHAQSQYQFSGETNSGELWVVASGGENHLRITALGLIQRIRLEVLNQSGERIYDSDFQNGSTIGLDFMGQDAQLLRTGYYGCLVTLEDLAGRVSNRWGTFQVKDRQVTFDRRDIKTLADSSTGSAEEAAITLSSEEAAPITLLAHNGVDGWIMTGKGGLSFRLGDNLSGKGAEQMRLTADGKLGIGVKEPQATLDVSGLIRTSEGIMFPDGTIQKTAAGVGLVAIGGGGYGLPQGGTSDVGVSGGVTSISQSSPFSVTSGIKRMMRKGGGTGISLALEGSTNTFYGQNAGTNTTGTPNSFFGAGAGHNNTTGNYNSFFGSDAGSFNTVGTDNAYFGWRTGYYNTGNSYNSFVGSGAGYSNTGCCNAFFGVYAGSNNTLGEGNSFFGAAAGASNTVEDSNTFIGALSDGDGGISNATALGAYAKVTRSNSLVLGSINGINDATADTFVGIGTTSPDRQLVVEGDQALIRFRRYYSTAIHAPALLMEHARGTRAAPEDILPGDYLGKVQFRGRAAGNMPEYGLFAFVASDTNQNGRFSFIDRDMVTERVSILNTGNMGIGTTNPTERLQVIGNLKVSGGILYSALDEVPDYVFEPNYKLMPIKQLENYLAAEKHLPNVPSAAEIKQKGLNLSEFQMKLLEKIEELTLYIVNQAKEIDSQAKAIDSQKKAIDAKDAEIAAMKSVLETRIATLEQSLRKEAHK